MSSVLPVGNHTQCTIYPTTMASWEQLQVEQFIQNFPGAQQMPLEEFVFANQVTNFVCGLGENCLVGQQCTPFQGALWFTLYALQEWNFYVNSLNDAISAAITQVREIVSSMVNDFLVEPNLHEQQVRSLAIMIASVAACAIGGLAVGYFGPVLFPAWGMAVTTDLPEASSVEAPLMVASGLHKRSLPLQQQPTSPPTISQQGPRLSPENVLASDKNLLQRLTQMSYAESKVNQDERLKLIKTQGSSLNNNDNHPPVFQSALDAQKNAFNFVAKNSVWAPWISSVFSSGDLTNIIQDKQEASRVMLNYAPLPDDNSRLQKRSSPQEIPSSHFATWTTINTYLNSFRDHLKAIVSITSQIGITAPVASDEGVSGLINAGKFMKPNSDSSQLQNKIQEDMRLSALAQVFKAMNVFVTIGSDKCNKKGPGGAESGKNRLSFCTPDGLMMNLIRASKNKSVNEIANAHLVAEKYGYTVEFLAQSAWFCHERNMKIGGRPAPQGLKNDSKAGCTFDLAVCDTRIPEVAYLRRKGKTTVVACRKGLALNI